MSIGPWQIVLILVIVLIIFGAGKLPRVAGDLAKGIKNFKKGMTEEEAAKAEAETETSASIDSTATKAESAEEKDKAAQG